MGMPLMSFTNKPLKAFLVLLPLVCCQKEAPNDDRMLDSLSRPGWKLVWHDEFEGAAIDTTKWSFQIGDGSEYNIPGWGNKELQWYLAENGRVENGRLVITARKETVGKFKYTSARMRTAKKGDWKYGRFEIRAKLPGGKGMWPAIWMLPTDWVYGGWAASGEIDIVELKGHLPNIVRGTLHYGGGWPNNRHTGDGDTLKSGAFVDEFHLFALEWDSTEIRWYVDDSLYQTQTKWYTAGAPYPAPFDRRFHLLLNVAVGGNYPGNPDETTVFPQMMAVDYVRVYQRKK